MRNDRSGHFSVIVLKDRESHPQEEGWSLRKEETGQLGGKSYRLIYSQDSAWTKPDSSIHQTTVWGGRAQQTGGAQVSALWAAGMR